MSGRRSARIEPLDLFLMGLLKDRVVNGEVELSSVDSRSLLPLQRNGWWRHSRRWVATLNGTHSRWARLLLLRSFVFVEEDGARRLASLLSLRLAALVAEFSVLSVARRSRRRGVARGAPVVIML